MEQPGGGFEKHRVAIHVLAELARGLPPEKIGVLLVGQAVGGDVVRIELHRAADAVLPLRGGLSGDSVDEVEVEVVESGAPQDGE